MYVKKQQGIQIKNETSLKNNSKPNISENNS